MCLYTRRKFPSISFKPIKVYKVLQLKKGGKFCSPFTYTNYVLNSTIKATNGGDCYGDGFLETTRRISGGYLHSYSNKEAALGAALYYLRQTLFQDYVIVECTIPIFTRYYEDIYDEIICSKVLKVGNIIKD